MVGPKMLFLDIETLPLESYTWGLWDQNIPLNMIKKDWAICSWAASWGHESKVMQRDSRNSKDPRNDKALLKPLRKLLDEADIIVTQNGKKFDARKINARLLINDMKRPSGYQHIDIYPLVKKHFALTSNKLEYIAKVLKVKHQKLVKRQFEGFDLWKECLAGNNKAWREMATYNILDVKVLKDCYARIAPWGVGVNINPYYGSGGAVCTCGSTEFRENGHNYTPTGKYKRYACKKCGSELKARQNLIDRGTLKRIKVHTRR